MVLYVMTSRRNGRYESEAAEKVLAELLVATDTGASDRWIVVKIRCCYVRGSWRWGARPLTNVALRC